MNKPLISLVTLVSIVVPSVSHAASLTPADIQAINSQSGNVCTDLESRVKSGGTPVDAWKRVTIGEGSWKISIALPNSIGWTVDDKSIPLYDKIAHGIEYGKYLVGGEGACELYRPYSIIWGPYKTIAQLKKMNSDSVYSATPVTIGRWTGVLFHDAEMCEHDTLALRVRGKTVMLNAGPCDSEINRDIVQIAGSIR